MGRIRLAATGDSIISQRVSPLGEEATGGLRAIVRSADAAFTNLEIALPKLPWIPGPEPAGGQQGADAYVLDELAWYGFNLFSFANNHAMDYTMQGFMDTLAAFEQRGLRVAGAGRSLGEARMPAIFETRGGKIALIAAASTFTPGALAANHRSDMLGRPGISPLRYGVEYVLDERRFQALSEIDEALGTADATRRSQLFRFEQKPGRSERTFLKQTFTLGSEPAVVTRAHERDLREIARWIKEARRQADLVAVTVHAHEGLHTEFNTEVPADFLREAAHCWIDAGADVFIGHGPHRLRAIELYQGKPIFYSLGNFFFQFESITRIPQEAYEQWDLPADSTPADLADAWVYQKNGDLHGFHVEPAFWRGLLPVCEFGDGGLRKVELHAVDVGRALPRARRGTPSYAGRELAQEVFDELRALSAPYGTELVVKDQGGRLSAEIVLPKDDGPTWA